MDDFVPMISGLLGSVTGILFVVVAFLFVISLVVFVHEMGHFLVARWCGVKIAAFSMGFGPEICAFVDRHGTRWRVAWFPLGGYVKFMDDENGASVPDREALERMSDAERAGSFHAKPLWQRAAVVAAGPLANFLLAIIIFAFMASFVGLKTTEARVGQVVADMPASRAGIKPGDLIVEIDGGKIASFTDMQRVVSMSAGRELEIVVERDGKRVPLKIVPIARETDDGIAGKFKRGMIGVASAGTAADAKREKVGIVQGVAFGVRETGFIITSTLDFVGKLFTGRESGEQLGGPIRIAAASGEIAKHGIAPLIHFAAFISVSVGLINLFPIPLLDGGHLMFYAIEAVRRRPMSERSQEIGFRIGLALVLMLMLFSTWNDRTIVFRWITGG